MNKKILIFIFHLQSKNQCSDSEINIQPILLINPANEPVENKKSLWTENFKRPSNSRFEEFYKKQMTKLTNQEEELMESIDVLKKKKSLLHRILYFQYSIVASVVASVIVYYVRKNEPSISNIKKILISSILISISASIGCTTLAAIETNHRIQKNYIKVRKNKKNQKICFILSNYSIAKIQNAARRIYDAQMEQAFKEGIFRNLADKLINKNHIQHDLGDVMSCDIEQLRTLINKFYHEKEILYYINSSVEDWYAKLVYDLDLLEINDMIL